MSFIVSGVLPPNHELAHIGIPHLICKILIRYLCRLFAKLAVCSETISALKTQTDSKLNLTPREMIEDFDKRVNKRMFACCKKTAPIKNGSVPRIF